MDVIYNLLAVNSNSVSRGASLVMTNTSKLLTKAIVFIRVYLRSSVDNKTTGTKYA